MPDLDTRTRTQSLAAGRRAFDLALARACQPHQASPEQPCHAIDQRGHVAVCGQRISGALRRARPPAARQQQQRPPRADRPQTVLAFTTSSQR